MGADPLVRWLPGWDGYFEGLYQAFVAKGGLDTTTATSEDFERMTLQRTATPPIKCKHGLTPLTCGICYLNGFRGESED